MTVDRNLEAIKDEFVQRLDKEFSGKDLQKSSFATTRDYQTFKQQYLPKELTLYEKFCQFAEKTLPFQPDKKVIPELKEAIQICHLNTTPTGVYSAAILLPLLIIFSGLLFFFILPELLGGTANLFFVFFFIILGLFMLYPLMQLPFMLANRWRMKASNQMVLAIFYVVTYMRHTSNLELAINFASEHLAPPLSLDLRKVIWDLETQKFDTLKDSLGFYLQTWRKWNLEFVESMNLIESSLYESTNERRVALLEKSLEVILTETYNKMLRYAHHLKEPLTTLNMLGVVLPILTLVILPLVVSFMDGFRWYHLFVLYNIILPLMVFYLGQKILSNRPGGSGNEDILEKNPRLKKMQTISLGNNSSITFTPAILAFLVAILFLLIGFFPLIYTFAGQPDLGLYQGSFGLSFGNIENIPNSQVRYSFLDYRERDPSQPGDLVGPYGLGALLLSILIPVGLGLACGLYYKIRTKRLVKLREDTKQLELEFASALFQLGNRIGDGVPAEIAFGKTSELLQDTTSGKFFGLVHINITRMGMSVEQAIFDKDRGAIKYFPGEIIESSMKVLVESSKKGPLVASRSLTNVAEYIQRIHSVDERLNDLMGDVVGSMKSQVKFLTPLISSVVIAITSLITNIIGNLTTQIGDYAAQNQGVPGGGNILGMFGVGIPTYAFQIVVGLYVIQLAYILSVIANGVENGPDPIGKEFLIGDNMTRSALLYGALSFILIIVFNVFAGNMIS